MRDAIIFLILTVLLVGAPALPLVAELRDPSCGATEATPLLEDEPIGAKLRKLAVQGHPFSRCLPTSKKAEAEAFALELPKSRAASDRSW